jgi:hypothetical protein
MSWDGGFHFDKKSRDFFWKGDADDGSRKLAEELGWKVRVIHSLTQTPRPTDGSTFSPTG